MAIKGKTVLLRPAYCKQGESEGASGREMASGGAEDEEKWREDRGV